LFLAGKEVGEAGEFEHFVEIFDAFVAVVVVDGAGVGVQSLVLIFAVADHGPGHASTDFFDHVEVVDVVVDVEEKFAGEEFDEDAADGPDIAGLIPGLALEDDFGAAVLASVDGGTMGFVLVGRPSEIDQLDLAALGGQILLAVADLAL
jgi:hypothetical protein